MRPIQLSAVMASFLPSLTLNGVQGSYIPRVAAIPFLLGRLSSAKLPDPAP